MQEGLLRNSQTTQSFLFPRFFQGEILRLETLKKKQLLGEVYQHELDTYKDIDQRIDWHYSRCFEGSSLTSYASVAIGGLLALSLNFRSGVVPRMSKPLPTQSPSAFRWSPSSCW